MMSFQMNEIQSLVALPSLNLNNAPVLAKLIQRKSSGMSATTALSIATTGRRGSSTDSGPEARDQLVEAHEIDAREGFEQESRSTYFEHVPVKSGFIHYHFDEFNLLAAPALRRSSCPTILSLVEKPLAVVDVVEQPQAVVEIKMTAAVMAKHVSGDCNPCAYYMIMADGCRNGENCNFCHLCDRAEIKRQKRQRAKAMKAKWAVKW